MGNGGDDMLKGYKGNDALLGGAGNDTYQYSTGDGTDNIVDSRNEAYWSTNDINILQFGTGIVLEDIAVSYDSTTQTVMLVLGNSDTLHIGNPAYQSPGASAYQNKLAIQQINFADGSVVTVDALIKQYGMVQVGTDAADILQGSDSESYVDVLQGGAGGDATILHLRKTRIAANNEKWRLVA